MPRLGEKAYPEMARSTDKVTRKALLIRPQTNPARDKLLMQLDAADNGVHAFIGWIPSVDAFFSERCQHFIFILYLLYNLYIQS